MNSFEYLCGLRKQIIQNISGIQNSGGMYFWDNTPANSATKRELSAQFAKDVIDAEAQGVLVVTRHVDCLNKNHIEYCVSSSKFGKKYSLRIMFGVTGSFTKANVYVSVLVQRAIRYRSIQLSTIFSLASIATNGSHKRSPAT